MLSTQWFCDCIFCINMIIISRKKKEKGINNTEEKEGTWIKAKIISNNINNINNIQIQVLKSYELQVLKFIRQSSYKGYIALYFPKECESLSFHGMVTQGLFRWWYIPSAQSDIAKYWEIIWKKKKELNSDLICDNSVHCIAR